MAECVAVHPEQADGLAPEYAGATAYENRSVNKGQGEYKEYFIKTPFPVPGRHGDFDDPNLAGWFRVREYPRGTTEKRGLTIEEARNKLSP